MENFEGHSVHQLITHVAQLSPPTMCALLGVHKKTLYRWIETNTAPFWFTRWCYLLGGHLCALPGNAGQRWERWHINGRGDLWCDDINTVYTSSYLAHELDLYFSKLDIQRSELYSRIQRLEERLKYSQRSNVIPFPKQKKRVDIDSRRFGR